MMNKKTLITMASFAGLTAASQAAVLADFSFSEWDVTGTVADQVNDTYTDLDAPLLAGVSSAQIVTAGFFEGGSGSYDDELNLASWSPGAMTLTIDFGANTFNLSSIEMNVGRNGAAATDDLRLTMGGTGATSDISGFGTHNGAGGAMAATGFEETFDLSGAAFQGLTGVHTFVIDDTSGDIGNLRINNFVVNAEAVPEPSSTALLGLGGLALILRRRR